MYEAKPCVYDNLQVSIDSFCSRLVCHASKVDLYMIMITLYIYEYDNFYLLFPPHIIQLIKQV